MICFVVLILSVCWLVLCNRENMTGWGQLRQREALFTWGQFVTRDDETWLQHPGSQTPRSTHNTHVLALHAESSAQHHTHTHTVLLHLYANLDSVAVFVWDAPCFILFICWLIYLSTYCYWSIMFYILFLFVLFISYLWFFFFFHREPQVPLCISHLGGWNLLEFGASLSNRAFSFIQTLRLWVWGWTTSAAVSKIHSVLNVLKWWNSARHQSPSKHTTLQRVNSGVAWNSEH